MKLVYLRVRNWVDRTIRSANYKLVLWPVYTFSLVALFLGEHAGLSATAFWSFGVLSAIWAAFLMQRFWVYLKESAIESGHRYESEWRYNLPPEYADSEDAWTTAERQKQMSERKETVDR